MANKNRFNIILTTLNTLVVFMLLNSCGGELKVNGINGTHTNFNKKFICEKMKDEQAICPNCKEGSRFLYKVASNTENNIILICEECNALWIDPEDISWTGATSDKLLKLKFNVDDSEVLFEEKSSGWATSREVETSEWNQLQRIIR